MIQNLWLLLLLAVAIGAGGCDQDQEQDTAHPAAPGKIRKAAVAGLFYPRAREDLITALDRCLAEAKPDPVKNLRGIISPHAGIRFSGPTAGHAYKVLQGLDIHTVIVLAPSHYARFKGASIPDVTAYETPLGTIPLSPLAAKLGKIKPFCVNPKCDVRRPDWWRQTPKEVPPFGKDTPHTWEHSLEVQLIFLQRVLKKFSLVPVVLGQVNPGDVARVLMDHLDEKTMLVASSDLSHFHKYDLAVDLDKTCIKAICSLNTGWMKRQEACGKLPILTLMHMAGKKGWKATLLDYRNSGDRKDGDRSSVVGYTAISFTDTGGGPAAPDRPSGDFTAGEQRILLALARKSLEEAVRRNEVPEVEEADVPARFTRPAGCFVTLTRRGHLRGCIGNIFPRMPLYKAILNNAMSAALRDTRFRPVEEGELNEIHIEVSVLTIPESLAFDSPEDLLRKLRPHVDGVVLTVEDAEATYLPQVWEKIPGKEEFLSSLARKAGLAPAGWRHPDARVLTYQVKAYKESEK